MVKPSWATLRTAPLWRNSEYADIRAALSGEPEKQSDTEEDAGVHQLTVRPPGSDQDLTLTVYDATQDAVPVSLADLEARAAVVLLDGTDYLAPQLLAQMERIAILFFGPPSDVQSMQEHILENIPNRVVLRIRVYVKPVQPVIGRQQYLERCLLLVGDDVVLNLPVCLRMVCSLCVCNEQCNTVYASSRINSIYARTRIIFHLVQ